MMYYFKTVLVVTVVSTISFDPLLANWGHFGLFLAIFGYPGLTNIFTKLPNIEIHIE